MKINVYMQELIDQLSSASVSAQMSTLILNELATLLRRQPMLRDTLVANHGPCMSNRACTALGLRLGNTECARRPGAPGVPSATDILRRQLRAARPARPLPQPDRSLPSAL